MRLRARLLISSVFNYLLELELASLLILNVSRCFSPIYRRAIYHACTVSDLNLGQVAAGSTTCVAAIGVTDAGLELVLL